MLTHRTYLEYLLSTPHNYTCTHLAAHLPDVSHDQVNRFMRTSDLPVSQLLKVIHRAGWSFFTTLKSNRRVSASKETGCQALLDPEPPAGGWGQGLEVRVKQVPFAVKRFKLVATNGDI